MSIIDRLRYGKITLDFKSMLANIIKPYFLGAISFIERHLGINVAKYFLLLAFAVFWLWEGLKGVVNEYWWESGLVLLIVTIIVVVIDRIKELREQRNGE